MSSALLETYKRLPVAFVRGQGPWLFDDQGNPYLDALGGIAVCALGHAHPAVAHAVSDQAATLLHSSNLYQIPLQQRLAEALLRHCELERVFFCNSGAEANEAAIKVARAYGHRRGVDEPQILVVDGSFHGRTLATLSATGSRKVHEGFEPLVTGFVRVPYDDVEAAREAARSHPQLVAAMVEPVLGEGGVVIPDAGYLTALRSLCDSHGWLLMVDEVQTGIGRTGRWFAHQHEGVRPDVMSLAKALGNGVPIGACLVGGMARDVLGPGMHGSTFGGNPLASRAALAVIDTIEREHLVDHAERMGKRIVDGLRQSLAGLNCVQEIRGRGMMIGVEMVEPCAQLVEHALDRGLLINVTAERVVRLLPPINLTEDEADEMVARLSDVVRGWNAGGQA